MAEGKIQLLLVIRHVRVTKYRMRWAGHVSGMGEERGFIGSW